MNSGVNKRVRDARKSRNYTQGQLAEQIGLKCSTYSQMERQGSISVEMAIKIAKVLDINPDDIIYGEEKPKKLDFSSTQQTVLMVNDRQTFLEQIKKGEDQLTLSVKEKNMVKIFRSLNDKDKKEVLDLINSKTK